MASQIVYEREGEWSGFSIKATRRGWMLERWSRIQGCVTGSAYAVPDCETFPQGMDLNAPWNDLNDNGQALEWFADSIKGARLLGKGHVVA